MFEQRAKVLFQRDVFWYNTGDHFGGKKYTFDEEIKGDRGPVQRGTIPDRLLESRPLHDNCAGRIPTMLEKVIEKDRQSK